MSREKAIRTRLKARTNPELTAYSRVQNMSEQAKAVQRQVKRRLTTKVKAEHTAYGTAKSSEEGKGSKRSEDDQSAKKMGAEYQQNDTADDEMLEEGLHDEVAKVQERKDARCTQDGRNDEELVEDQPGDQIRVKLGEKLQ